MTRRSRLRSAVVAMIVLVSACASDDDATSEVGDTVTGALPAESSAVFTGREPESSSTTTTTTTTTTSTTSTSTTTSTTTTSTTTTSTTTTTTTLPAGTPVEGELDLDATELTLGTSVDGRPIVAERYGSEGGRRVLAIGVIHGNEDAGVAVIDRLRATATAGEIPDGIELWLVESMNPDGQVAQDRHNANEVDLNRNFPYQWGPIGEPGDGQYAGPESASEPETQAMVNFIAQLRPDLALWYHQDANLIIPGSGRDGDLRARYAELTELPLAQCCASGGGIYTGIAATWARNVALDDDGVAFIVELPGGDLTDEQVAQHTNAVLTIATEL